jgi:hypothetical protein
MNCLGHTYDREAILGYWASGVHRDPLTNLDVQRVELLPNHALRGMVQSFLDQHPLYTPSGWPDRELCSVQLVKDPPPSLTTLPGPARTLVIRTGDVVETPRSSCAKTVMAMCLVFSVAAVGLAMNLKRPSYSERCRRQMVQEDCESHHCIWHDDLDYHYCGPGKTTGPAVSSTTSILRVDLDKQCMKQATRKACENVSSERPACHWVPAGQLWGDIGMCRAADEIFV